MHAVNCKNIKTTHAIMMDCNRAKRIECGSGFYYTWY